MTGVLKKLFRKNAEETTKTSQPNPVPASKEPPTIPIPEHPGGYNLARSSQNEASGGIPHYEVGCAQSVGRVRDHNEDSLFTFTSTLSHHHIQQSMGVYIIADGMGGHRNGELASSLAVKTMAQNIINQVFQPVSEQQAPETQASMEDILRSAVHNAHQAVLTQASGSGTTLTAALIIANQITVAHVGDSRCYFISPGGEITQVTRDHSLVMRMIELGQLTKAEAAVHPQRNVLYRAIGQGEPLSADIQSYPVFPGGYILICSDGLWGVVPETKIAQTILVSANLQHTCELLVQAANEAGGPDNITAILVRLPGKQE